MDYTTLPHTDIKVSKLCLGTMTFGQQNTLEEGHEQLNYALDKGINFIDTAELYPVPARKETYGETERIIGNWFKKEGKRQKVVLASKIAGPRPFTAHIRTTGYSREALREALHQSLNRLQTDYLDLYQLHWPERETNFFGKRGYVHMDEDTWTDNIEEVLETLQEFINEGKVRYIGLSNETPWGAMKYIEAHRKRLLPRMITIQNPYSLLNRLFEVGLAEVAHREGMGLLAYSPMGFGVLSGKYLGGKKPEKARVTLFPNFSRYSGTQSENATAHYASLAKEHGLSLAQMSLAFVTSRPFVTSNIIGATTMSQLKENIGSIEIKLAAEILKAIEKIQELIPNPAP